MDEDEGGEGSHLPEDSDDHEIASNRCSSLITFSAEKEQLFEV